MIMSCREADLVWKVNGDSLWW